MTSQLRLDGLVAGLDAAFWWSLYGFGGYQELLALAAAGLLAVAVWGQLGQRRVVAPCALTPAQTVLDQGQE